MLTDLYKKAGIPLKKSFGISYPEYFYHPAAEYYALVNCAGVIDLTHWTILRVTGNDRTTFLNAMLTNDVSELEKMHGCHSLITTTKGKIVAELFVFARKEDHLIFVSQGDAKTAQEVLDKHIISEDVTVENLSHSHAVIAIEGPKAYDCLWRMFPTGPFPKNDLEAVERQFEHIDFFIWRNSVTGEEGYHMMISVTELERMRNYLVQAARGSDGLPVGRISWNIRRTENGLPWFGYDFSGDNFPNETRLEETVSYSKGCFLGQETLARLKYRGHVNRVLVGMTVDEETSDYSELHSVFDGEINRHEEGELQKRAAKFVKKLDVEPRYPSKTEIFFPSGGDAKEKAIGWITTSVFSPQTGKPIFLGYVRHEAAGPGTHLILKNPKGPSDLSIIDLPVG